MMKLGRRSFIATILAAPLAVIGALSVGHTDKVKVTEIWMRSKSSVSEQLTYTTSPISPSKDRIVVVVTCEQKNGEGKVLRYMDYPGKEIPWVHIGTFNNCNGILGVKRVL